MTRPVFSIWFAAILCALTGLTACASPYKPDGLGGGYSETWLNERILIVSFRGNGYTSRERAADLSLLRAAEIALNAGYPFFAVADSAHDAQLMLVSGPSRSTTSTTGNVHMLGGGLGTFSATSETTTRPGNAYLVQMPIVRNVIVLFDEKPPDVFALDARFVTDSLRQKYGLAK